MQLKLIKSQSFSLLLCISSHVLRTTIPLMFSHTSSTDWHRCFASRLIKWCPLDLSHCCTHLFMPWRSLTQNLTLFIKISAQIWVCGCFFPFMPPKLENIPDVQIVWLAAQWWPRGPKPKKLRKRSMSRTHPALLWHRCEPSRVYTHPVHAPHRCYPEVQHLGDLTEICKADITVDSYCWIWFSIITCAGDLSDWINLCGVYPMTNTASLNFLRRVLQVNPPSGLLVA